MEERCFGCELRNQIYLLQDYIAGLIESGEVDSWDIAELIERECDLIDRMYAYEGIVELVADIEEF